jgi:predicted phosphodiesterase
LQDPGYVRANLWTAADPDTNEVEPFLTGLEAIEAVVLKHRVTGQEILIVHGHQGDFTNDQAWQMSRLSLRYFWRYLHAFGAHSPSSPTRNAYKRHKVERNYVKWIQENCIALICGHTHREKFPKHNEMPYFNSGSCLYPSHITALEIVNSTIALVRWRVDPNEDGFLQVTRRVIAGPEPLHNFDLKRQAPHDRPPCGEAAGDDT